VTGVGSLNQHFLLQTEKEDGKKMTTMRLLLPAFSRLFDPLGFSAPFVITAIIQYQELWRRGSKWDDPLPADIQIQWSNWVKGLALLSSIKVPRFYFSGIKKDRGAASYLL